MEGLEGSGDRRLVLTASRVVKMRANAADAPYVVAKAVASGPGPGPGQQPAGGQHPAGDSGAAPLFHWEFELAYARLAQQMMVASRLPPGEAGDFLQVGGALWVGTGTSGAGRRCAQSDPRTAGHGLPCAAHPS